MAVADGKLTQTELDDLNSQVALIGETAQPFYDALAAVGLNVTDAADSLESASKNFSNNVNRNLDLVRRINTITTAPISSIAGTSSITVDLSGSNFGNNSVADIKKAVTIATQQANIAKLGVK